MKLLVKNAQIATSTGVFQGDVLTDGEVISHVAASLSAPDAHVIDASGKYLLPGGVDVHTHFDLDVGTARTADDFLTGSIAAACGGTTTIVDHMGFGPAGCRLSHQVNAYHGLAEQTVIDYGFHGVIQHFDNHVLEDMETLIEQGISSYKVYLTYGYKLADEGILPILARANKLGLVTCFHCENDASIRFLSQRFIAEGKGAPKYHALSRPAPCEAEAVWRMLMLANMAGEAPVYIVHLSSQLGLEAIRVARHTGQKNIFAETCPQYLLLNDSHYDDEREGLKYIISPPLRGCEDNQALWNGAKNGDIDVIATDHCPFFFASQKMNGLGNFTECPNGAPGVEPRMALLFSEGFMKQRLTLPEIVTMCCTKPAQVFGMYPQKGDIKPGCDADMVLFDPTVRKTLTKADLHEHVDYTPYEGIALHGAPAMTISRGEIIVENGEFKGQQGRGRYLKRKTMW